MIAIHPAAPQQLAIGAQDLLKRGWFHVDATVIDGRVGGCHIHHGLLGGAEGQGVEAPQLSGDAQAPGRFDHLLEAQLLQQPHRHRVERVLQRHHHRHRTEVAVAEVFWAVAGEAAGRIAEHSLRQHPLLQGREIHKQLEGGAGRAQGLGCPIELAVLEVGATHHRPHQAGARLHRHQSALHAAGGIAVHRRLGLLLPGQIDAAAHCQTTHLELLGAEHLWQLLLHPAAEVGGAAVPVFGFSWLELQRCSFSLLLLTDADEARLLHAAQHHGPPLQGQVGIHQGRINRGGWWQPCDQGGFREG